MIGLGESAAETSETVRRLYAELEQTNREVLALTLELEQRVDDLRKEVADRKRAEADRQAQVDRLKLLNQISRAIDERQDLRSILQVAVRSLEEHLPLDFCCACLSEPIGSALTLASIGCHSQELLSQLAVQGGTLAQLPTQSPYLRGQLLCEADLSRHTDEFSLCLARMELRSLIVVPLRAEGKIFGAVIAARGNVDGFVADECDFIRQLSEQVGLAAHQAMLHAALEQAYEEMRRTQHVVMQQERLRALGQLAGGIAHDINNALSPAALYLESILERDPALSRTTREYLSVINTAIESVGRTVARMRMFYSAREPEVNFFPVDLNRMLREAAELTRVRWRDMPQERGIIVHLESELAPGLPPVMGAENEVRDAITNLLLNAVDAMPEGGTLTLRSGTSGGARGDTSVFLEVCDTGIGMTEEVRHRCLEPFFTTKGERGTGLGLAMVYGMTQRHGAQLEIDSAPGKGTVMRLIFPGTDQHHADQAPSPLRKPSSLHILLVDDDPLLLRTLQDVLESEGHTVTSADGGQRGIDEFLAASQRGEPFRVVITDLGMPKVNGQAVATAVKTATPDVRVILLTGWGARQNRDRERPRHIDRVLSKPPRLSELRSALAELVG